MRQQVVVLVEQLEARSGGLAGVSGPPGSVVMRSPSGLSTRSISPTVASASAPELRVGLLGVREEALKISSRIS